MNNINIERLSTSIKKNNILNKKKDEIDNNIKRNLNEIFQQFCKDKFYDKAKEIFNLNKDILNGKSIQYIIKNKDKFFENDDKYIEYIKENKNFNNRDIDKIFRSYCDNNDNENRKKFFDNFKDKINLKIIIKNFDKIFNNDEEKNKYINDNINDNYSMCLLFAYSLENEELTKLIIKNKKFYTHYENYFLFRLTCSHGKKNIAEIFVNNGVDVNTCTELDYDYNPDEIYLFERFKSSDNQKEFNDELVEYNLDKSYNFTAIELAAMNGYLETVKFLFENGANIDNYAINMAMMFHHDDVTNFLYINGARSKF